MLRKNVEIEMLQIVGFASTMSCTENGIIANHLCYFEDVEYVKYVKYLKVFRVCRVFRVFEDKEDRRECVRAKSL